MLLFCALLWEGQIAKFGDKNHKFIYYKRMT